jgi:hypothetical protein
LPALNRDRIFIYSLEKFILFHARAHGEPIPPEPKFTYPRTVSVIP